LVEKDAKQSSIQQSDQVIQFSKRKPSARFKLTQAIADQNETLTASMSGDAQVIHAHHVCLAVKGNQPKFRD